jgi:hypothetical protein
MLMRTPSAESLVRLLIYISGIASTIVGSFIANKIRVYQDNRNAHLDDIKGKVLVPIKNTLTEKYGPLVNHRSPVVVEDWGVREQKAKVSVTEYPTDQGPILVTVTPNIGGMADQALYVDARERHFRKLVLHVEQFLAEWQAHANACHTWVLGLSQEILDKCQLPEHPVSIGSDYIMQYRLAVFVYRRLFQSLDRALSKRNPNPGGAETWSIEGFDGTAAQGSERQIDTVLSELDRLIEREKSTADRLRADALALADRFSSLRAELSYAIAGRRLHKRCNFVPFF